MRALRLDIRNFLGIDAAEIAPDGRSIVVTGGNAQGKTSILEAVKAAFIGAQPYVIHDGAESALIQLDTEEISIEREITATGSKLSVKTTDGIAIRKPQTYLSEIFNALAANPVKFFLAKPDEQRNILFRAMPATLTREELRGMLNIHPDDFDRVVRPARIDWTAHPFDVVKQVHRVFYDTRHAIGVELKSVRSNLSSLAAALPDVDYPAEAHDELKSDYEAAEALSIQIAKSATAMDLAETQIRRKREQIEALQREIAQLQTVREQTELDHDRMTEDLREYGDLKAMREALVEFSKLAQRKEILRETEERVRGAREDEMKLAKRHTVFDTVVERLSKSVPEQLAAQIRMPFDGLEFTDDGIRVNGRELQSLSGAERMRIAISIAEAGLPANGARILCIDGTEALDSDAFEALRAWAALPDSPQCFITRVTGGERRIEEIETEEPEEVDA